MSIGHLAQPLVDAGWFCPAYIRLGEVQDLVRDLKAAPDDKKRAVLETALVRLYHPVALAPMMTQRYAVVPIIKERKRQIAQAIESAASGNFDAAVSTLLPVVEAIIRLIGESDGRSPGHRAKGLSEELQYLIDREANGPSYGDATAERVDMLSSFKQFFDDHLYVHTDKYQGHGELNRPGVLHGLFKDFGNAANFGILISILDHLTFFMSLRTPGISAFGPDPTPASEELANYYRKLAGISLSRPVLP